MASLEAGMVRLLPAYGLRPKRAGRLFVVNVPKPAIRTSSSFVRASLIAANTASTAPSAADFTQPHLTGHTTNYLRFVHPFASCKRALARIACGNRESGYQATAPNAIIGACWPFASTTPTSQPSWPKRRRCIKLPAHPGNRGCSDPFAPLTPETLAMFAPTSPAPCC